MTRRIIDISRPITAATPVWPGDTPFAARWVTRLADGASVNLSSITLSPHTGTHADAPLHVREGAAGIGEMDLDAFVGEARVLEVLPGTTGLIEETSLAAVDLASPPRLLLRTGTAGDGSTWPAGFAALSPGAARRLVRAGVKLVGLDTPSVDPEASASLEAHHILLDGGVVWLEGLALDGVPVGCYELLALPLRVPGLDASPVRAVLRTLTEKRAARPNGGESASRRPPAGH